MTSKVKGAPTGSDVRLINAHQLGRLIQKSASTIWKDLSRNPSALPPYVRLPGKRGVMWLESTVYAWLAAHEVGPAPTPRRRGRPRKSLRSGV